MDFEGSNMRYIIELKCGRILEGGVKRYLEKKLYMSQVVEYPSRSLLPEGSLIIDIFDLTCIKLLTNNIHAIVSSPVSEHIITLQKDKYQYLMQMAVQYIYLSKCDSRYFNAIINLKRCGAIGVVAVLSKNNTMDLLVMSTNTEIYLFDLKLFILNEFPTDLKMILESNNQHKILHDGNKISRSLFYCHKVKLNNVFDTQLADLQLRFESSSKIYRSFSVCLSNYFNFPNILNDVLKVTDVQWQTRPLEEVRKEQASRFATFLIPVKEKQAELLWNKQVPQNISFEGY